MKKSILSILVLFIVTHLSFGFTNSAPISSETVKTIDSNHDLVNEYLKEFKYSKLNSNKFTKFELMTSESSNVKLLFLEDENGYKHTGVFSQKNKLIDSYLLTESECNEIKTVTMLNKNYESVMEIDFVGNKPVAHRTTGICSTILNEEACACIKMAVDACAEDWECVVLCGLTCQWCMGAIVIACTITVE